MAMAWAPRKCAHLVLCIWAGHGHMTPMMNLAKILARLSFSITVVVSSPKSYSSLCEADLEGLDILVFLLPGLEEEEDGDHRRVMPGVRKWPSKAFTPDHSPAEEHSFAELLSSFPSRPIAVISDMMITWCRSPAAKFCIRNYVLYPASLFYMAATLLTSNISESGLHIPGLPIVPWNQLPSHLRDTADPFWANTVSWNRELVAADGILVDTFYELEGKVWDVMSQMPETKSVAQKMVQIGPFIHPALLDPEQGGNVSSAQVFKSKQESICLEWLDRQPPSSVMFVSFGSWASLEKKQLHELAIGLKSSQHKFLLVVLESSADVFPQGFIDSIQDQGLVLFDWAPQHLILRHTSLGGFLTHCGWNSILECITLGAVPMVCWPFMGDQPLSCRYVVDELKIGVDVECNDEGFVAWEEVERCVKMVMEGSSKCMRQNALQLQKIAQEHVLSPQKHLAPLLHMLMPL